MRPDLLNRNLANIKPSATLTMSAKAAAMKAEGLPVINLAVGEPDYDTPDSIKAAAKRAIDEGKTKYTPVEGVKPLREAICAKFLRENDLSYKYDQVIVSSGAKQTLFVALAATINEGDEVILPAPFWLSYLDMVLLAGGKPVVVQCGPENSFKITSKQLQDAITPKTKWIIINSPSNPTGSLYSEAELYALGQVLLKNPHVMVMSDDIYEHMIYDNQKFYTIAQVVPELKDRTLTVNGASKSYSMTGWRLGYGAGPIELIKAMAMIQSHTTSHASSISQYAVIDSLNGSQEFLPKYRSLLQKRRDLFFEGLSKVPFLKCQKPAGAFYMWVDCSEVITGSNGKIKNGYDFAMYLLEKAMVVGAPGEPFGAENYIRFSYTVSEGEIVEACKRIEKACFEITKI
jgi:aspartate aminotransferase